MSVRWTKGAMRAHAAIFYAQAWASLYAKPFRPRVWEGLQESGDAALMASLNTTFTMHGIMSMSRPVRSSSLKELAAPTDEDFAILRRQAARSQNCKPGVAALYIQTLNA